MVGGFFWGCRMTRIAKPLEAKRADGWPRRADRSLWTEAEQAIQDAIDKIEALGADPLLTAAVTKLGAAKDNVADYLEGKEAT